MASEAGKFQKGSDQWWAQQRGDQPEVRGGPEDQEAVEQDRQLGIKPVDHQAAQKSELMNEFIKRVVDNIEAIKKEQRELNAFMNRVRTSVGDIGQTELTELNNLLAELEALRTRIDQVDQSIVDIEHTEYSPPPTDGSEYWPFSIGYRYRDRNQNAANVNGSWVAYTGTGGSQASVTGALGTSGGTAWADVTRLDFNATDSQGRTRSSAYESPDLDEVGRLIGIKRYEPGIPTDEGTEQMQVFRLTGAVTSEGLGNQKRYSFPVTQVDVPNAQTEGWAEGVTIEPPHDSDYEIVLCLPRIRYDDNFHLPRPPGHWMAELSSLCAGNMTWPVPDPDTSDWPACATNAANQATDGPNLAGDIVTLYRGDRTWTRSWDLVQKKWVTFGGFVGGNLLVSGGILASHLSANAVTANSIAANAVTALKIAADAVEADKIAANAVTAAKIAAGAIATDKLVAGAVTRAILSGEVEHALVPNAWSTEVRGEEFPTVTPPNIALASLALDEDGNILATERRTGRIWKWTGEEVVAENSVSTWNVGDTVRGLARTSDGENYLLVNFNNAYSIRNFSGSWQVHISSFPANAVLRDLTTDENDRFILLDTYQIGLEWGRLWRRDGNSWTKIHGLENRVYTGVCVDASGTIYVLENRGIVNVNTGEIVVEGLPSLAGSNPRLGLATNASGDFFLANNLNIERYGPTSEIADGSVTEAKLANLAVTGNKIADAAIVAIKLADGSVDTAKIAAAAVESGNIADANIVTAKLAAGAVVADKIAANAVVADKIAANAIGADKIAANAVVADKIAANAIVAGKIAAEAIETAKLKALAVTAAKIAAGAITADKIAANTITGNKIAANTITAADIAANTITASQIAAGAIGVSELAASSVTASKIRANAITASKIAAKTITGDKISGDVFNVYALWDGTASIPTSGNYYNSVPLDYPTGVTYDDVDALLISFTTAESSVGNGMFVALLDVDRPSFSKVTSPSGVDGNDPYVITAFGGSHNNSCHFGWMGTNGSAGHQKNMTHLAFRSFHGSDYYRLFAVWGLGYPS